MTKRSFIRPLIVGGVVGVLAVLGAGLGMFSSWNGFVRDRFFLSHAADPSIVVVAIDNATLGQVGTWPWPRTIHAKIIDQLHGMGAKVIAYDVMFADATNETDDARLQQAIESAGNVVLPVELTFSQPNARTLLVDPSKTVTPLTRFTQGAKGIGHANTPPDADGIVRRIPLMQRGTADAEPPAFALEALRVAGVYLGGYDGTPPVDQLDRLLVNYLGPPGSAFRTISAADVLYGRISVKDIEGKTVFVGYTASDIHDEQLVPTSNGRPMAGVEIHASLYDTLLRHRWLWMVPDWIQWIVLLFLGLFIGVMVPRLRIRVSAPLACIVWFVMVNVAFVLFDRGIVMDVVWPSLVIAIAYAAVTVERRMIAERERRELRSAFSRYVSASVVESIMRDPSRLRLGGEKRRMTVLFSDIRGFTSLSELVSPELLVEILNTYLTRMTGIVFSHDGVLDKYIGDAVMAFWNAPFDQKDHARRAVQTALEMQRALAELNAAGVFPTGVDLKIGVGVNTGDMVVGNMGSEKRFDYTVMGDSVNLGSRLEGITKEYGVGILVTETTRNEVGEGIVFRRVDRVAVKGKKEPVTIYEAIGLDADVSVDMKKNIEMYERALQLYWDRDFTRATEVCTELLLAYPGDGPSGVLLERARMYQNAPPPADWDGRWIMTKK